MQKRFKIPKSIEVAEEIGHSDTILYELHNLSRRPLSFKSFTGLEITEFDIISKEIESKYYEHERKSLSNRKRKRDVGAGTPFKLKLRERFLMLLVYYRLYITFTLSGFLFDLDQSNVCRDISRVSCKMSAFLYFV